MKIKTRFSPSPTGYLHIGSLRTALYNYLFAKKHNGVFLLRIEDTDKARTVDGAADALLDVLQQVGLNVDEGPYVQSERIDIYKTYVDKLLEQKNAYHCFCTKERLIKLRENQTLAKMPTKYDRKCCDLTNDEVNKKISENEGFVVRMKVPEGETSFKDDIRGVITISNSEIDDQVILKSDGFPTYHLAVVIDDHLMEVTHVIRGEEWISSVPKHVILYSWFGFDVPNFAHLPLILNEDKTKLSKRQGDVAVEDFLKDGYLPDALINFIALLGFNPKGDQEIYSMEELVKYFELTKINKGGAVFNREKLDWMNGKYISELSGADLSQLVESFLDENIDTKLLEKICEVEKGRLTRLDQITSKITTYTTRIDYLHSILVWKKSNREDSAMQLDNALTYIEGLSEKVFTDLDLIEDAIKGYINSNDLNNGNVLWPLRVSLSSAEKSSSPFELLWILGKNESIERINIAISKLKNGS